MSSPEVPADVTGKMDMWQSVLLACIVLFPLLWFTSDGFRYNAKFTYFNVVVVLVSGVFVIPYGIFRPRDVRNLRPVAWGWTQLFKVFGLTFDVRKEQNLVSDEPYVLVSNHQSSLDLMGMMKILPDRCTVLAKKELLYAGTFGLAAWLCGLVFVDRLNKEKALDTMNKTVQLLKNKKLKLWIYPEGTRNRDGNMLPFKKGAFHLAIQAQIPVVPVVFSTYRSWLSQPKKVFNPGKIIIECLPPVQTKGMTGDDVDVLIDKVRGLMVDRYREINKELGPLVDEICEPDCGSGDKETRNGNASAKSQNSEASSAEMNSTVTSTSQ